MMSEKDNPFSDLVDAEPKAAIKECPVTSNWCEYYIQLDRVVEYRFGRLSANRIMDRSNNAFKTI